MVSFSNEVVANKAERACDECKRQKRKCDKLLPHCSLCTNRSKKCRYTPINLVASRSQTGSDCDFSTDDQCSPIGTSAALTKHREPMISSVEFPSACFLDQEVFLHHHFQAPGPKPASSTFPFHLLHGDGTEHVAAYYKTAYSWLPMIAKDSFYASLSAPLHSLPADIPFIILCMRLSAEPLSADPADPHTDLYCDAKACWTDVQAAGVFSLRGLQGGLLIALYEIGHAIYPAAFLTVGALVRYARVLGLGGPGLAQLCRPFCRSDLVEKQRVWWAVALLDRIVNLGCPKQSLLIPDPESGGTMPMYPDNTLKTAFVNAIGIPGGIVTDAGCTAVIAESTKLLGKAILHACSTNDLLHDENHIKTRAETERQLFHITHTFVQAAEEQGKIYGFPIRNELPLCYSATLTLCTPYLSPQASDQYLPSQCARAVESFQIVATKVLDMCREILTEGEAGIQFVSPLVLHSIYKTASGIIFLSGIEHEQEFVQELKTLYETLRLLNRRWKVAGAYLRVLEAREIMSYSP